MVIAIFLIGGAVAWIVWDDSITAANDPQLSRAERRADRLEQRWTKSETS